MAWSLRTVIVVTLPWPMNSLDLDSWLYLEYQYGFQPLEWALNPTGKQLVDLIILMPLFTLGQFLPGWSLL